MYRTYYSKNKREMRSDLWHITNRYVFLAYKTGMQEKSASQRVYFLWKHIFSHASEKNYL